LDFVLQFCPTAPEETALHAEFDYIGIAPGRSFAAGQLAEMLEAMKKVSPPFETVYTGGQMLSRKSFFAAVICTPHRYLVKNCRSSQFRVTETGEWAI
jgi:hypothetical protein